MFKWIFKLLLISCTIFLFLFSGQPAYADDDYRIWNEGSISTVDTNKVWTVTFNKDVDINTAKDSIKVYESDNNDIIPIDISYVGNDMLKISPEKPYEYGKNYVLVIGSNLKDTEGSKISRPVKYNFKINSAHSVDSNNIIVIHSYQEYYNTVKNALVNYDPSLSLNIPSYDKNTYSLSVIDNIMNDSPDLRAWYESAVGTIEPEMDGSAKMNINFKYDDTKDNLIKKNDEVNEKVTSIVSSITNSSMKDYEKELVLHDYVVNNAKYDQRANTNIKSMPADSYTAYGILINGVGVCQGYADAMYRLLTAAGIKNTMVIGDANNGSGWVGHAWNIVEIQGMYYQLDTTWDDPVTDDGSNILSHSYFNVTDAKLSKDHRWDTSQYPKCTSTIYDYTTIRGIEAEKQFIDNYTNQAA